MMCISAIAATTKPTSNSTAVRSWGEVVAIIAAEAKPGEDGRWDRERGTRAKQALERKLIGAQLAFTVTVDMIAASRTVVDSKFELVDGIHCGLRMITTPDDVPGIRRGDRVQVTGVIKAVQVGNYPHTKSKAAITLTLRDTRLKK